MKNKVLIIFLFLICLTACGKREEVKNSVTCIKSDNESYQYVGLLGTTYTLVGLFNEEDNIYEYHMDVDMNYDKKTDEEIFNEYVLENEENVSSFDTSNSHIKYASSVDKSKKIISYSMKVTDIDEDLGKSGEIFIPSMYSKDGFRKSLEKNGYECK